MKNIGFTNYDSLPVEVVPTTAELVASLTTQEKVAILDGFSRKVPPRQLRYTIKIPLRIIVHLYRAIDAIEERARVLMRGEVLVTPAEYDPETGEETSPAVYNTPPSTAGALLTQVQDDFADDFSGPQVQAILTKMVEFSKHDGSGDWIFYKTEVVK